MKAEFDLTKMVEEISMQAKETQEEFIFETIHPYCEHILQIKINKEELKQILLNGMRKQQPCDDCISREDAINVAIDAVDEWDGGCNLERANMINKALEELPSVTLQSKIDEIIKRIEETRDKDKLCEYPYNRCIDIAREVLG